MSKLLNSLVLAAALFTSTLVIAQNNRIDIVTPGGPGSFGYTVAETLAPSLRTAGLTVNYVPKPGAGGKIAISYLRQRADSRDVLVAGSGIVKFETVASPDFESVLDDYMFIGPVLSADFALVTSKNIKLAEIFKDRRQYTVSAANPAAQFIIDQVNAQYPGKFLAVPYRDSNQSWIDMMGGHIDIDITRVPFARGRIDKSAVILAVTAPVPKGTPSLTKYVPGINISDNAIGLLVRKNTDLELVSQIEHALNSYYSDIYVKARLSVEGYQVIDNKNGEHNRRLIREIALLKKK